jgi:hypothetical protein
MKSVIVCIVAFLFIFSNAGYCNNLTLIECGMIKDGGSRCIEYRKDGSVVECCIDHRSVSGTNEVFIGGYPTKPNAKIISEKEMRAVYDDVIQFMNSDEYKKYSVMTRDELRSFVQENNLEELRKAMSYRYLKAFKDDLSVRLH